MLKIMREPKMLPYWKDGAEQARKAAAVMLARKNQAKQKKKSKTGAGAQAEKQGDAGDEAYELTVGTQLVGGTEAQVVEHRATVGDS